jgi:hypothetical protein
MRRLAVASMGFLGVVLLPTGVTAAAEQGELTIGVAVRPGQTDGIPILTESPTRLPPGRLEGDVHEEDGAPSWDVTAVGLGDCEGEPARASGISGVPVCLVVGDFPSATAATGTVRLDATSTLKLAINSHHPRWIAVVVTLVALLLGAVVAYLAAIWIPTRRRREDLESAINGAAGAGVQGVPEWLAALPPSLDEARRAQLLTDATATLEPSLTGERRALQAKLASLARHGDLVDPDFSHPDIRAAAAEARSTSLPIERRYDTFGERAVSEASRWALLVHQLTLIASQIDALRSLVPDLPQPRRQQAENAAGAYIDRFRNLAFPDPGGPFPNLDGMNAELGQLFREYAPHTFPAEIPTAVTPPPEPTEALSEGPPTAAWVASSVGIARLVLVVLGVAAVATVLVTVGMGETFGSPLNYLTLAATAFGAGAGAQAMLGIVPFARRG